jgi:predicted nucleotidyltransferase
MAQLARMRGEILATAARHGATNVRVFGSVARGEAGSASDVDFLLEDLLGISVDVVTEPGLKARIRQRVLAEAVPV